MNILLNGERREVEERHTLHSLVQSLGLPTEMVIVEHNLKAIPKNGYGNTVIQEGDRIEIVRFVGGG